MASLLIFLSICKFLFLRALRFFLGLLILFLLLCVVSRFSLLFAFYSFESFSHQRSLIVFHLILSYNKSSQVIRTFLSILADLNNAVVWMVSTRPLFSPFTNPLWIVRSASISPLPSCFIVLFDLWQGLGNYLSFLFLLILLCGMPGQQSLLCGRFSFLFFFVDNH